MVRPERVRELSSQRQPGKGPVVYWMNREGRLDDNWAYLYARERAEAAAVPLVVIYNLAPRFLGGGYRQHAFKVGGLLEVEKRGQDLNTPLMVCVDADAVNQITDFVAQVDAHLVVTDMAPLQVQRAWLTNLVDAVSCPVYEVDAHNIVPVWVASQKAEFAARTIRPKLARLAPEYLEPFPELVPHTTSYTGTIEKLNPSALLALVEEDEPISDTVPGYGAGMHHLACFIADRLESYDTDRNNPMLDGQSGLSPYLHYGHIAPARVALAVCEAYDARFTHPGRALEKLMHPQKNGSGEEGGPYQSFIEELIVRRELADNFCFYTQDYDTVGAFPAWAQATLNAHRGDTREYLYTYAQLQEAQTHDELWNAAQRQMVREGKMHGYMRMYWGKKILEWTHTPEEALAFAIRLNDRYELDGRDPNGYVGIAWSIGGVHDRPWFNRETFGTVRYMARSGCEKKFDVDAYIARYS